MQLGHVVGQLVETLSYELEGRWVDSASNINEYSYNKTNWIYKFLNFYFWNRTLHVSDSFSVHRQESRTVHTAIVICHMGYADWLLESITCMTYTYYCVYSARLLMMDRETARKMYSSIPKINLRN